MLLYNKSEIQDQYLIGSPFTRITLLIRLGIESTCFWSSFTSREYQALALQILRSCKLYGRINDRRGSVFSPYTTHFLWSSDPGYAVARKSVGIEEHQDINFMPAEHVSYHNTPTRLLYSASKARSIHGFIEFLPNLRYFISAK
ncbi:hypothetical protein TNCV_3416961 [Trichonephila clavipes]|nr:hypothetical protein TNCV_3416961 [Trichonephila clavipes]